MIFKKVGNKIKTAVKKEYGDIQDLLFMVPEKKGSSGSPYSVIKTCYVASALSSLAFILAVFKSNKIGMTIFGLFVLLMFIFIFIIVLRNKDELKQDFLSKKNGKSNDCNK